jgi:glycosyltransferase involved in cell wall biosynthesis
MEPGYATHLLSSETFGLKPKEYVLYLGRFSPEKNCHLLINAFQTLETPMKLVLAGGSSHTDEYAANLYKHQSDRIKLVDWLSGGALEEILTNAALFVLPSDMEGMSLSLLDAMGAGVCVLATDVPENVETIGNAGFTFRRGDAHDLQRLLTLLLGDPALREETGRRAQERVRQQYLWESVATQMNSVYESLMSRSALKLAFPRKAFRKAA